MIELLAKDGHDLPEPLDKKEFSGKFVLRVEPALHRRKSQPLLRQSFGAGVKTKSKKRVPIHPR